MEPKTKEEERALIRRCLDGDEEAWGELVEQYGKFVYAVIYGWGFYGAEADELSQDVWGKVFTSLPGFKGDSSFMTWLHTVLFSIKVDYLRKKKKGKGKRSASIKEETEEEKAAPAEEANKYVESIPDEHSAHEENALDRILVHWALDRLPEQDRGILKLRYIEDMAPEKIAEVLGISAGYVYNRCPKALEALHKILKEEM